MERSIVLTGDVLEEILSRLPGRQLLRLRCVCKSWCACIDDSFFMKKQYQFQYAMFRACGDVPILLVSPSSPPPGSDHARFYLLSKQQGEDVVRDLTPALQRDSAPFVSNSPVFLHTLWCRGVVNGVFLLEWWDKNCNQPLSLWNPVTREFKVLPDWPSVQDDKVTRACPHIIGLGFDPVSYDFKVVGYVSRGALYQFEMYSLHTNSWKKLKCLPGSVRVDYPKTDSYLNGTHYWASDMLDLEEVHSGGHPVILSLNFNAEVFRVSYPPQHATACLPGLDFGRRIGLYKDSLAWIVRRDDDPTVCRFDVWIVTKFDDDSYGVPLSWQHLLTIGPIPLSDSLSFGTFRMDGDVLFLIYTDATGRECEANVYNPSMCTFKKLGISFGGCYRYIESLFRI